MSDSVLTLILPKLTRAAAAVATVRDALSRLGASVAAPEWLAPETACDLVFEGLEVDQADSAARLALATEFSTTPFDLVAQPCANRRKQLLVADMESTIIENEMLDELADLVGLRDHVAEITRRAMNDEIDFATALKERVALLKGLPQSALAEAGTRIRLMPGAATLVATMRAHGAFAVLVSGGFRFYTSRIRAELGFDRDIANDLIIEDGDLAGTVREPILTRDSKLQTLKSVAAERGLALSATLAVGDGANDLPMIEAAGLGVAFHGKPAVAARARARIDCGDLTALLYYQGYRAEDFVAA